MKRILLWLFALSGLLPSVAWGGDSSMLKPPKGSKVAIIVFEDLECPECSRAAPQLHDAAKTYKIPLVQYDFPLRQHPWSMEAAVNARFFDTKSTKIGDEYRLYIFQNQPYITKQNLRGYTEKFAEQNKVVLPFVVDPSGDLAAKVNADSQLGQRIPLEHTPTIFVVSDTGHGTSVVEVKDRNQLYQIIDQAMKEARESAPVQKAGGSQKTSHAQ
jgi:protein-disulfide isomerase